MLTDLERQILEHVNRPGYHPVKPRVIAKKLGFSPDDRTMVRRTVKKLVRKKKLIFGTNHLVHPVIENKAGAGKTKDTRKNISKQKSDEQNSNTNITGRFQRAAAGFGFVRPEGTPRDKGRDNDIFVPIEDTGDAVTGDTVEVEITRAKGRFGQRAGKIVQIKTRKTHQFVGTYFEDDTTAFVQVDGGTFKSPISVGDPGVKNANGGDKVVIEIVRFPTPDVPGEGVITQVLGDHAAPGVDTRLIMAEFSLPGRFPKKPWTTLAKQANGLTSRSPKTARI